MCTVGAHSGWSTADAIFGVVKGGRLQCRGAADAHAPKVNSLLMKIRLVESRLEDRFHGLRHGR